MCPSLPWQPHNLKYLRNIDRQTLLGNLLSRRRLSILLIVPELGRSRPFLRFGRPDRPATAMNRADFHQKGYYQADNSKCLLLFELRQSAHQNTHGFSVSCVLYV